MKLDACPDEILELVGEFLPIRNLVELSLVKSDWHRILCRSRDARLKQIAWDLIIYHQPLVASIRVDHCVLYLGGCNGFVHTENVYRDRSEYICKVSGVGGELVVSGLRHYDRLFLDLKLDLGGGVEIGLDRSDRSDRSSRFITRVMVGNLDYSRGRSTDMYLPSVWEPLQRRRCTKRQIFTGKRQRRETSTLHPTKRFRSQTASIEITEYQKVVNEFDLIYGVYSDSDSDDDSEP
jgi:hypothetical protein